MILRGLYRILLRLRPREWRAEMLHVFEQARVDARTRGWLSYTAFGLRELAGMLSPERAVARVWPFALGGAMVGLLAGGVATFWVPEVYVSRAVIRVVPSAIPERYAPSVTVAALSADLFRDAQQEVLKRSAVVNLIQTYDLFAGERFRMPLEDVVELVQKATEVKPERDRILRLAFSYRDPLVAQRVTRALLTSLVDETNRQRQQLSELTVEFLNSQAERAAAKWEELGAKARSSRQSSERASLDVDLAKQRYVTLRQQLAEAELAAALEERKQAPTLEVLDLPSLPENPELSHATILSAAAAIGLTIGLLAGWVRRIRLTRAATPDIISA